MVARLMQEAREAGGPSKVEWILILSEIKKGFSGRQYLKPFHVLSFSPSTTSRSCLILMMPCFSE